ARRALLPEGIRPADVVTRGARIAAVVEKGAADEPDAEIIEVGGDLLMPGLVDTHVHVNDPGRAGWGGFEPVMGAAAAGGITTLVDMPLNSIPATTSVAALAAKRAACEAPVLHRVGCAFWGGVVPGNAGELEGLARAGVRGFKCFLVPSGVDEFAHVGEADLAIAMPILARLGLPLLVHAESPAAIAAVAPAASADPRRYTTWLDARPAAAEVEAVRMMLRLCESTRCAVHVVHLSAAEALQDLRAARARGLPVTVETCPHYLTFAAEEIGDGATEFKCAPPIRGRANRERLWEALRAGDIDMIVSDHSPCVPELKHGESGDFVAAWGGIESLAVSVAATWAEAQRRGFTVADLARWMSAKPAALAGFGGRKGVIAPGADADLIAWNPDAEWTVDGRKLPHRNPVSPYEGRSVRGVVHITVAGGEWVTGHAATPLDRMGPSR
ncbi:MAG: allantoinase AllB, partial [Candidatus Eisenbacteria bacterium]|nr:allantoinase AllB [Candidatus Eisenbacteria bacterium]